MGLSPTRPTGFLNGAAALTQACSVSGAQVLCLSLSVTDWGARGPGRGWVETGVKRSSRPALSGLWVGGLGMYVPPKHSGGAE